MITLSPSPRTATPRYDTPPQKFPVGGPRSRSGGLPLNGPHSPSRHPFALAPAMAWGLHVHAADNHVRRFDERHRTMPKTLLKSTGRSRLPRKADYLLCTVSHLGTDAEAKTVARMGSEQFRPNRRRTVSSNSGLPGRHAPSDSEVGCLPWRGHGGPASSSRHNPQTHRSPMKVAESPVGDVRARLLTRSRATSMTTDPNDLVPIQSAEAVQRTIAAEQWAGDGTTDIENRVGPRPYHLMAPRPRYKLGRQRGARHSERDSCTERCLTSP